MNYKTFAMELIRCRSNHLSLQNIGEGSSLLLSDSFNIQKEIIALINDKVVGWKLGGTNHISRETTGFYEVVWGPLFKTIFTTSATLSDSLLLGAEVEVALKLSDNLDEMDLSNLSIYNYDEIFSQVALAIELPCSVVNGGGGAMIIADLCASGYAVLSTPIEYKDYDSSNLFFDIFLNDTLLLKGDIKKMCGEIEVLAIEFLQSSNTRGFSIAAGQWVLTGGLSPLIKMNDGDVLVVESSLFSPVSAIIK